ncbi:uncharacterized protein Z520_05714 [Fonsecaea multimorphosa CBS 102226]|uniref:Uncharacterized protein n=1 Tax=Fonsecaea multimorphosa CBS 102226 TaxID=1442371 RepID=A0A0D2KP31_9EURO|nr:uncharacterized protein Z520_05714 [Fonsecaea multimorphosa CBS 102226]KIX98413.1 hypothetical protein Z520_05714 [Fonsecaea multimorphosa CBS 102226]OAL24607.1 hypothetical protein AYO22_05396 [Fonsecaea multimorphosa]
MFEVPDAKRVKRSDLFRDDGSGSPGSRGSSRSPSPARSLDNDEESILRSSYGFEYDFVAPNPPSRKPTLLAPGKSQPDVNPQDEEEDQEFQFRLFTSNSRSIDRPSQPDAPTADARIRLSRTPEPAALADSLSLEKAHFLRPNRPDSYYFTSALPGETIEALRSQYADVALSTADVLARAKSTKWPGSALPWRLIHVELLGKGRRRGARRLEDVAQSAASSAVSTIDTSTQRSKPSPKRPSKKRRILLRRRLALRQELAAQATATEETEREKRTRRNREKKVKRKEREKRKKLEEAPEGEEGKPAGGGVGDEEEQKVIPTEERNLATEGDVRAAHSGQEGGMRSDHKDSAAKAPDLATTAKDAAAAAAAAAVLPTNMSTSSAPTRRAPTSRAPTTAATVNPRVSRSLHPTRPRA